MTQEHITSVVEILDSAHNQKFQLSELLTNLRELKQQVQDGANESRTKVVNHFDCLKTFLEEILNSRLTVLLKEIDSIENQAVLPLTQCEVMIQNGIDNATTIMEEGKLIMKNGAENNLDKIVKLKENPLTKTLSSVPEIPDRSAVPCITVDLASSLRSVLNEAIQKEGKVIAGAPVQITDIAERPGSLLVKWNEIEEEGDLTEFCLQYSSGNIKSNTDSKATFHTAYVGPNTGHIVKHLRPNKQYSFRVRGRQDGSHEWSVWSVPYTAITTIPHHQWVSTHEGYSVSNEDKTATRTDIGLSTLVYSNIPSYASGEQLTFKILDAGERSLNDGIGLACNCDNKDTLEIPGAIFVNIDGTVYVDGNVMKMKLPPLKKGSAINFQTEPLPNGKVRVGIEVQEKEVTFDWKTGSVTSPQSPTMPSMNLTVQRQYSSHNFYFAMKFAHEDWKVGVD
ncbi:hypothetical protein SNE40_020124 [Patella caerulea]